MEPALTPYGRAPLEIRNGIPVFSAGDDYTDNYTTIAEDHLAALRREGKNPFIPEELWVQTEDSTRALIEKYMPLPGAAILDVGCGLGRLLGPLTGCRKYGMDISTGYLEVARDQGIDVCYSRIEDMPYREESFDVVSSTDVLEHVFDLNLCCGKMLRVLKRGGVLVVRVPYREDLSFYVSRENPYRYVHMRNFDEYSLRLLFEKILGCELLEFTLSGYVLEKRNLKYRIPRLENLFRSVARRLPRTWLVQALFHPVFINIAVRKP